MRAIAKIIASKTNHSYDEVMNAINNQTFIKSKIKEYYWLTDEVLNQAIYYPLEGYLFPDTYVVKNKDEKVEVILDKMLARTNQVINGAKKEFDKSNQTYHQVLTMASIVELEAVSDKSRSGVASVFYNRLQKGMSLGSDVTTYYAAKIDMSERDLTKSELNMNSPYNTRGSGMNGKLPIGPISNPGLATIKAVLNYSLNDDLFFVADKNKKVYFTKTYSEHQAKVKELKTQGLWYEWT